MGLPFVADELRPAGVEVVGLEQPVDARGESARAQDAPGAHERLVRDRGGRCDGPGIGRRAVHGLLGVEGGKVEIGEAEQLRGREVDRPNLRERGERSPEDPVVDRSPNVLVGPVAAEVEQLDVVGTLTGRRRDLDHHRGGGWRRRRDRRAGAGRGGRLGNSGGAGGGSPHGRRPPGGERARGDHHGGPVFQSGGRSGGGDLGCDSGRRRRRGRPRRGGAAGEGIGAGGARDGQRRRHHRHSDPGAHRRSLSPGPCHPAPARRSRSGEGDGAGRGRGEIPAAQPGGGSR